MTNSQFLTVGDNHGHYLIRFRLALGQVSPLLVLRNFGAWYAAAK